MSQITGRPAGAGEETIRVSVLMDRLVSVLDDVCTRLADVQGIVADHLGPAEADQKLSDQHYMEHLQSLDALTQEVEAVRAVLARLGEMAPVVGDGSYGVEAVLSGVRLSQVKAILKTGVAAKIGKDHGDFTLF